MSISEDISYTDNTKRVVGVRFGILSPQRILQQSVAEIYKPINPNQSFDGTLADLRMGTNSKTDVNRISELSYKMDPGNFGHLRLAKPVIQNKYYETIIKILNMVCFKCSSLLVDKNDTNLMNNIKARKNKGLFAYVKKETAKRPLLCPNCGIGQPKFMKGSDVSIQYHIEAEFSLNDKRTFNQEMIYYILCKITDEDCMNMGIDPRYSRPDWMLWIVMPIPPPTMRPTIKTDTGQQSEDHLTKILTTIININNKLTKELQTQSNENNIKNDWSNLQLHVAAYIDNEKFGVLDRSSIALHTLRKRIEAKRGRVRNSLMGKRVDYSARSVITPDPNISIDELGVPISIAMKLDIKEIVTPYNITVLHKMVQNGANEYPGANKIRRTNDNKKIDLSVLKDRSQIHLDIGDIVYRHLMDGDWVLFNRQPSLHRLSMMAHRIKIMEVGDTFRLNITVTSPYNADFDGDEMNMHVPRSYQTSTELAELAAVSTQIITPQQSTPAIHLVQDAMLAAYKWTKSERYLNIREVMKLLIWTSGYRGFLPKPDKEENGEKYWSAHAIYSVILPNITYYAEDDDDDDSNKQPLKISYGKMDSGVFSKKTAGSGISKIIHRIWKDYGSETTRIFLDDMMNLSMQWLLMDGFSIGLKDTFIDSKIMEENDKYIQEAYKKAEQNMALLRNGNYEIKYSSLTQAEQYEFDMQQILADARAKSEKNVIKNLPKDNRMKTTVLSGSKGKPENITKITSCIGQQMLAGQKRLDTGYTHRTLPHYPKYDLRPEAHGFIQSNYLYGLNPSEYWMEAVAGREGVIATAIETASTGYLERKLIKVMEDLRVMYDGTVRNANNFIISHIYGGDGYDGCKVEKEKIDYFKWGKETFLKKYKWNEEELKESLTENAYKEFIKNKSANYDLLEDELNIVWDDHELLRNDLFKGETKDIVIFSPVKFSSLLIWIENTCLLNKKGKTDITPTYVIQRVKKLLKDLFVYEKKNSVIEKTNDRNTFKILVRCYLFSKKLIYNYRINKEGLDMLILKINEYYLEGLVAPGEMIGIIAGQSISEPLTQKILDAFHSTGTNVGLKTKIERGIPRFKEILSTTCSDNMKTPSLTIHLKENAINDGNGVITKNEAIRRCENILDLIENTTLDKLLNDVNGSQIYFDPDENNTVIEEDEKWIKEARELFDKYDNNSPWLIRLKFNSKKIQNITMDSIVQKLFQKIGSDVLSDIITTSINAPNVIMRIRVNTESDEPIKEIKEVLKKILLTQVKGIHGINGGIVMSSEKTIILPNDDYITPSDIEYKKIKDEKNDNYMIYNFTIETDGVNLHKILSLSFVDKFKTESNDIYELLDVFGIEATREYIIRELQSILGDSVTKRHTSTLADAMTGTGVLVSVDRYGVNKTDTGVLSRATFEETTKMVTQASIYGEEEDNINGVSANIMFGQFFVGGTNSFDLMLDEELLTNKNTKLYDPKDKIKQHIKYDLDETKVINKQISLDFEFSL